MRWCLAALLLIPRQDDGRVFADPKAKQRILEALHGRLTAPRPPVCESKEAWPAHRAKLRAAVLAALGLDPLPERVPLDPAVSGARDYDDYRLERVWWRSLPDVWAGGWLYLPKGRGPHPAVLNPHGHWDNGARHPVVQSRCIALARRGFVALAVDAVHVTHWATGLCSVGMMTWNNMRAVDYLESRPDVDKSKIGCTGASGGGQQTMYLMATDERIAAAVPVVMISYFSRILFANEQAHCSCNHVPGILRAADEPQMTAAFAPKPALYISVTGDWTAAFPKEEFPPIHAVYEKLGAAGRVESKHHEGGHDYNRAMREQMVAWFNRWLKGIDDAKAAEEAPIKAAPLDALAELDKPAAGDTGMRGAVRWFVENRTFKEPSLSRERLLDLLGETDVQDRAMKPSVVGTADWGGGTMERLTYPSEAEVDVPALLFRPKAEGRRPAAIVLSPGGKRDLLAKPALVEELVKRGFVVLAPDVRLRGELRIKWDLNCVAWGRPEAGMAAHDVKRAVDLLAARDDVDPKRIACIGLGDMGVAALLAGAIDPRLSAVAASDLGKTYGAGREHPILPRLLRHGDLPQIAALCSGRLWLNRARPAADFRTIAECPDHADPMPHLIDWVGR